MSNGITLQTLATIMRQFSKDNYRIEKNSPSEKAKYVEMQSDDADKNGYIDIMEYRNYYLRTQSVTEIPVAVNNARCAAADALLNATEADDPQNLETALDYLTYNDTSLSETLYTIACDKSQPNIRQYLAGMTLYMQGIGENEWDAVQDEIFDIGKTPTEPVAAIYAQDYLFSLHRFTSFVDPQFDAGYAQVLLQAVQNPEIYNNPIHMRRALRVLCELDKKAGAAALTTYVLEQLGKPLPPYDQLQTILYEALFSLEEQALPLFMSLARLTTDQRFQEILRKALNELAEIQGYAAAQAAITELNGLSGKEATPGDMINTLLAIGGNNQNLLIERTLPAEANMYALLAGYDSNTDGSISVPEYRKYYLEKTKPQTTAALFSEERCQYIQDLFSTTPTTKVITGGPEAEDGISLVGHTLGLPAAAQENLKTILATMAQDTQRPGLARLAAVQNLKSYLSFNEAQSAAWQNTIATILQQLSHAAQDPATVIETAYYLVCQCLDLEFLADPATREITPQSIQKYVAFLEKTSRTPQYKASAELQSKYAQVLQALKENQ